MKVLHLTLEKKWFDMISSGVKREEYRAMKPYWHKRIGGKSYDAVLFRKGYAKNAPAALVELRGISVGMGAVRWGAPEDGERVYILNLGRVIRRG